jgi:hypothetical protein
MKSQPWSSQSLRHPETKGRKTSLRPQRNAPEPLPLQTTKSGFYQRHYVPSGSQERWPETNSRTPWKRQKDEPGRAEELTK